MSKIIDYPEVTNPSDDDYLIIETSNGTKKVKKKNVGGGNISDISIIDGHLIVTFSDGTTIDKGACGDMTKNTYDKDGLGVVDNSEKVNGFSVNADVPSDVNDRVKASVNDEILSLIK